MTVSKLAFIDSSIADFHTLLANLPQDVEAIPLDPRRPGLSQIAQALDGRDGITAVHILSHGADGTLFLGNDFLTARTLKQAPDACATINRALAADADILIYGCEVAASERGEAFVAALAEATGANIAASRTLTGAARLGGDWQLDLQIGAITTPVAISAAGQAAFQGVLSTTINYASNTGGAVKAEWVDGTSGVTDAPGITLTLDYGYGDEADGLFTNLSLAGLPGQGVVASNGISNFNGFSNGFQLAGSANFSFEGFEVVGRGQALTDQTFTIRGYDDSGNAVVSQVLTWAAAGPSTYQTYSYGSGGWTTNTAWQDVRRIAVDYTNDPDFQEFAVINITVGDAVGPVNTAPALGGTPADDTATEDVATAIDLSAYNLSDADGADGDDITLTLAVDRGTISSVDGNGIFAGVTIATSGTTSMTLQGTAAALNAYLDDTSKITFTTGANDVTTAVLTVTPNDGTSDGAADTVNISIQPANDAPVLDTTASPTLAAVDEDAGNDNGSGADGDDDATDNANNPGTTVAALVVDGSISDVDGSAVEAIAVSQVDNTNGVWQFSTNAGASWSDFSATTGQVVSLTGAARLLDGTAGGAGTNLVRFVPDQNYVGQATLTIHAWDKTTGSAGGIADLSSPGGTTAFSTASDSVTITVNAVNDAPVFNGLDATPTYSEGGSAVVLDNNVTLGDAELSALNGGLGGFNGAVLTISRNGGANATDSFGFELSTAGFTVVANQLQWSAAPIATFTEGGGQLQITFLSTATSAQVNNVLQHITYANTSDDPNTSAELNWVFSDGNSGTQGSGGAQTVTATQTVAIGGVNDAPTLSATGQNPIHVEGAGGQDLFSSVTFSLVEQVDRLDRLTLTVTNVADGAAEILSLDGTDIALSDGTTATTATNGLGVSVSVNGSTATLSFSGATLTAAQVQTLIDGLTYRNTSDAPTTVANRVVTITQLVDTGGTAGGGSDTSAPNLTSTVSLTAVNDAPTLQNLQGDDSAVEPGQHAAIDRGGDVLLGNPDSSDYSGGVLTIADSGAANSASGSFSVNGTTVTSGGDATLSAGETIAVGGTSIGTVHAANDGQDGRMLQIDFTTADASNANVQALIRALTWGAASGTGQQTFTLTLNDGDGTANGGAEETTADFTMSLGNRPVIANLSGDSVAFVEDGGAVLLDANADAALSDADSANFGGGSMSLAYVSGQSTDDRLVIDTSGAVSLSAAQAANVTVSVGGTVIGTLRAGAAGGASEALVIDLTADATPARLQQLISALSYTNISEDPGTSDRVLSLTVADDAGLTSDVAALTVSVAAQDDAPTLTATSENPGNSEGATASDLFSSVTADAIENGQTFTGLTLTIDNLADGAAEVIQIDGSTLTLTHGTTLMTATNSLSASVTVSGTTATVTISGATLSAADLQTLIDGLAYENTSDSPQDSSTRAVTITGLTDSGSATGGNSNAATLSLTSVVTLTAVNDAPDIANITAPIAGQVVAGSGAQAVSGLAGVTVSDVDSPDFNGGTLVLQQTSGTSNGSWGVDGTVVTASGGATLSAGASLAINGTVIGTVDAVSDGQSGSALSISFTTTDATPAAVQLLLQNLTYAAPTGVETRSFSLTLTDGDGTANGGDADVTVPFSLQVTSQPPEISNLNGDTVTFVRGQTAVQLDAGSDLSVSDPDNADLGHATLTVSLESGAQGGDLLLVDTTGTVTLSSGQTDGSVIAVGGTDIGTISATGTGGDGEDLVIVLMAGVAFSQVETLLDALRFDNSTGSAAPLGSRSVGIRLDAADGATSDMSLVTVTVTAPPSPGGGGSTPQAPVDVTGGSDGETFDGTNLNDTINGDGNDDLIRGGLGLDSLTGGIGNDTIRGNAGEDELFLGSGNDSGFGGDGNDLVLAGPGQDLVRGHQGNDTLHGGSNADTIFGGRGNDSVFAGKGNDNVYGRADDDHLRGGWGDDTIHGGTGSDTILAGQGHDTVYGGEGSDRVRAGWGDDKVFLGLADDHVFGGKGNDTLIGGMGRDTLNGGAGNDRLRGGADSDTFIFAKGRGMDTIADFDATMDVLELRNFGFSSPQEALSFGGQQGDDFVFSFDDGSGLILRDVSEAELSSVMIIL
ncbi:DUF4347 domain-containing protein [Phaeobacter italicus]|uniref:DUF4347 domain-containing protein n=1 Tax=Phaeobacter italicus TaxID=481446 RepID=UPI003518FED8